VERGKERKVLSPSFEKKKKDPARLLLLFEKRSLKTFCLYRWEVCRLTEGETLSSEKKKKGLEDPLLLSSSFLYSEGGKVSALKTISLLLVLEGESEE